MKSSQVSVVSGETGCGKTTQVQGQLHVPTYLSAIGMYIECHTMWFVLHMDRLSVLHRQPNVCIMVKGLHDKSVWVYMAKGLHNG